MIDRKYIKSQAKEALKGKMKTSVGLMLLYCVFAAIISIIPTGIISLTHNVFALQIADIIVYVLLLFVLMPLIISIYGYFLDIWRCKPATIHQAFDISINYKAKLCATLWVYLWVFIWSLFTLIGIIPMTLIIAFTNSSPVGIVIGMLLMLVCAIPAFIKSYSYLQIYFLINEYPDMGAKTALKVSIAMMKGYKWNYFVMQLSFILWMLLPIVVIIAGAAVSTLYLVFTFAGSQIIFVTLGTVLILLGAAAYSFVLPYFLTTAAGYYEKLKALAIESGAIEGFDQVVTEFKPSI